MRAGHGWVRMCGKASPAANVSYRNFTLKFGNEIPNQGGEINPGAKEEEKEPEKSARAKEPITMTDSQGVMDLAKKGFQIEAYLITLSANQIDAP